MVVTGNKGEWSEYYAFLKLLVDMKLNFGGPSYDAIGGYYVVKKVSRVERDGTKSYTFEPDGTINIFVDGIAAGTFDGRALKAKTEILFSSLLESRGASFPVLDSVEVMQILKNSSLKASSASKEDLIIKVYDDVTGSTPEIGFSIKSIIGGAPTLLNASKATNFVYEVKNLNAEAISSINSKTTIRERLMAAEESGGSIEYIGLDSKNFEVNLQLLESTLPIILAKMIQFYYIGSGRRFEQVIDAMITQGVVLPGINGRLGYEYRLQNLLFAIALGMVPNTLWDGNVRAPGGYIVVKKNGELVSYSAYNSDDIKKNLLQTCRFETPDTGRHGFGYLYEENGKVYIKLNLQIRFV